MYCLELIKFDASNTSYYVEVENGALLRNDTPFSTWKFVEDFRTKSVRTLVLVNNVDLTTYSSFREYSLHALVCCVVCGKCISIILRACY